MYFVVYTLLKVGNRYDLSVLSISVMGFHIFLDRSVGGVISIQFFGNFF